MEKQKFSIFAFELKIKWTNKILALFGNKKTSICKWPVVIC